MYFYNMKKIFFLTILSFGLSFLAQAQIAFKGKIIDSVTQKSLSPVSIENMTTHAGTVSGRKGYFEIQASYGDYILFKIVGYKNAIVQVKIGDENRFRIVSMDIKPTLLNEVIIKKGPTQYQIDSANRASLYKSVYEYDQQKSVFSPVTTVYQKFSKRYKNLRKFQTQILSNEQQKYISTRYSEEIVKSLTPLTDQDEIAKFMNAYPMEYDYARAASDLEVKMWIKYNYQDYIGHKK